MPLLINGVVSTDSWVSLDTESFTADAQAELSRLKNSNSPVIYPIAVYLAHKDNLNMRAENIGLLVTGDDDLTKLSEVLHDVALIAIDFPVLRDGRGFSIARNITRRGFEGQVRAVGDVSYDRLDNMHRSGFNAYQIPSEYDCEAMISAFTEISVNYQPTHVR